MKKTTSHSRFLFRRKAGAVLLISILSWNGVPLRSMAADNPEVDGVSGGNIPGSLLQINGHNFQIEAGQDILVIITQNGIPWTEQAGGDDERAYVEMPENLAPGPITLQVVRRSKSGAAAKSRIIPYAISAPPKITGVSPSGGQAGMMVTITGVGFGNQQKSSKILFVGPTINEPRASINADIVVWSDKKITAIVPQGLSAGRCDVRGAIFAGEDSTKGVLTDPTDEASYVVQDRLF